MKRLSIWQKAYLVQKARQGPFLRRAKKERDRRRQLAEMALEPPAPEDDTGVHQITIYRRGKVRFGTARERRPMPANFCLVENYEEVSQFLIELRHRLTLMGQRLENLRVEGGVRRKLDWDQRRIDSYVDFASLTRITPSAALVLASEYDRAISVYRAPEWLRAVNVEKWDPAVLATLKDVGFLSLLGVDSPVTNIAERNGIVTVPFLSGSKVQGASIDKLIRIMAEMADSSGIADSETLLKRSRVYDGLGEAIQNVEDHAYPVGAFRDYPVAKKWWMTGAVELGKKRFTIAIYDQGISIPVSLPRWTQYDELRATLAKSFGGEYNPTDYPERDGETISAAVQLGRSSTGKEYHGKGLPVIKAIIDNCAGGTVRILSRNGEYSFSGGQKPSHASHKLPIAGTLVEWEMLL